jgi:hypothetical protein
MNHQLDIVDRLVVRPVKEKRKKTSIAMNKLFQCKHKTKIKLPKKLEDSLKDITNPKNMTVRPKR